MRINDVLPGHDGLVVRPDGDPGMVGGSGQAGQSLPLIPGCRRRAVRIEILIDARNGAFFDPDGVSRSVRTDGQRALFAVFLVQLDDIFPDAVDLGAGKNLPPRFIGEKDVDIPVLVHLGAGFVPSVILADDFRLSPRLGVRIPDLEESRFRSGDAPADDHMPLGRSGDMGAVGLDVGRRHPDRLRDRGSVIGENPDRAAAVVVGRPGNPDNPENSVGAESALSPAHAFRRVI